MLPCSTNTPINTPLSIYLYIRSTLLRAIFIQQRRSVSRNSTTRNLSLGRNNSDDTMPGLSLPPFPDDIPTIPLLVIDYELIKAGDVQEIERLWDAATDLGFW